MTRDALMLLRGARARCANGGWSRAPATLNQRGEICDPKSEEATFFDLLGALHAGSRSSEDVVAAWEALDEHTKGQTILWEDTPGRTEADVLALFDRAIARATALIRKGIP